MTADPSAAVVELNRLPEGELRALLLAVCASRAWADAVARQRPFGDTQQLHAAAERTLAALDEADLDEALAGHPRIGERAEGEHAASSRREQLQVEQAGDTVRAALVDANRDYEQKFGHVYLVCAMGRSGEELLDVLRARMANDAATERKVLRDELAKINAIRLNHLLTELGDR